VATVGGCSQSGSGLLRALRPVLGGRERVWGATIVGQYLRVRQDRVGTAATACPALFVYTRGQRINPGRLSVTFNQVASSNPSTRYASLSASSRCPILQDRIGNGLPPPGDAGPGSSTSP